MIYHYDWFIKSHFYIKATSENDSNILSKHYLVMKKGEKSGYSLFAYYLCSNWVLSIGIDTMSFGCNM